MKISILTLFPEMFQGPFEFSIVKRAQEKKLIEINIIDIRDFGIGRHKIVDDTPYGGGIGMVMRPDVLHKAIEHAKTTFSKQQFNNVKQSVVLLSATGQTYNQQKAQKYAKLDHLILICGHYEGVDERIKKYITEELSIGDFVLTGGEIPSMLITDSVTRLVTGVLKEGASDNESFSLIGEKGEIYLEYPHYTKPPVFDDLPVPDILLSGNHRKIDEWRMQQALEKTQKLRPDLLKK
jgi:tRNA (guanine37-N1)-methyltransferase